jgi:uncharacterized membrane protein
MERVKGDRAPSAAQPSNRNVRLIGELERRALDDRSAADRLSDAINRVTGSVVFAACNLVLVAGWLLVNTGSVPGLEPFDPFPFSFLTLIGSLEAIFLAIFVLMSQNRMARQADKRAHLNLQVDLLAEQELTTMLQMLNALCAKLQVDVEISDKNMLDQTDVQKLASALEDELPVK